MIFYKFFEKTEYKIFGTKKKYCNIIFSFDIETSSFFIDDGKIRNQKEYDPDKFKKKELKYCSTMYIWMLGINDHVYFGRTWNQFVEFLDLIEEAYPENKIFFVHNLSFEFQFFRSVVAIDKLFARSQRKPIYCRLRDYKIEFRCTYFMSNNALEDLPEFYDLPVEKMSGDLDYSKIRHSLTALNHEEWKYCENDILVVYHYILYLLENYPNINKIPKTNTGQVREELKDWISDDYNYKKTVRRAINQDPHVYNLLTEAFAGGYTHANYFFSDLIIDDVDSWDIASSYPFVMLTEKFPGSEFKKCKISDPNEILPCFAYIIRVKFKALKTRFQNNIISYSHCRNISGAVYDNGRVIKADELEIVCTDVDLRLFMRGYEFEDIEILEAFYSIYKYLHPSFIRFILKKYELKTTLKGVKDRAIEYIKEKNRFNSLYGMSVTNTIRNEIEYSEEWSERSLTNDEIVNKLKADKKKGFLSFSYGVWVTAYARRNLIERIFDLDRYVIYADTDSLKLYPGYDRKIIDDYNRSVKIKIMQVCQKMRYKFSAFCPKDIKGKKHLIGIYEYEGRYDQFKTLGAKKYIISKNGEIEITVAGVPKEGASVLKNISEFKKGLVFRSSITGKNAHFYNDDQDPLVLTDYKGIHYNIKDKTTICILPSDYTLGVTEEYSELFGSRRCYYKE